MEYEQQQVAASDARSCLDAIYEAREDTYMGPKCSGLRVHAQAFTVSILIAVVHLWIYEKPNTLRTSFFTMK
jgi:hypothetical protein